MISPPVFDCASLLRRFESVRARTLKLQENWSDEDCLLQAMPDASPVRWHLAHTSWFFEAFVLGRMHAGYQNFDSAFGHLFNSYYESIGTPFPRAQRGLLSRPGRARILLYRKHVEAAMAELLRGSLSAEEIKVIEIGLQHEEQHQELMLTDLKLAFSINPSFPALFPAKRKDRLPSKNSSSSLNWVESKEAVVSIGTDGGGFSFDNERPSMRVLLEPFRLASRLISNCEYAEFIDDGGYGDPTHWLSDGWGLRKAEDWNAPIYWRRMNGSWYEFSVYGLRPLEPAAPVSHLSFYEADAYARWAGARLPTEAEWEHAAQSVPLAEHDVRGDGWLHPEPAAAEIDKLEQMFGELWQWTASPYTPYRGYRTPAGALGEYNGKFMCNQIVLRGGSCATSPGHVRASYRNFFGPETRWQFSGLRLALDAGK